MRRREGRGDPYLEAVIDVQARNHHQEAVCVHTAHQRGNHVAIPAFVAVINKTIDGVCAQ